MCDCCDDSNQAQYNPKLPRKDGQTHHLERDSYHEEHSADHCYPVVCHLATSATKRAEAERDSPPTLPCPPSCAEGYGIPPNTLQAFARLAHLRTLQAAAVRLGQPLEHPGTFADDVPLDVWARISQAGAEIAASAKALAEPPSVKSKAE